MDLGVQILRILCATVEEKSFSGAARKLKITQPTVSQQIARLESEIDGRIFERSGKSIHLTVIGEKLYRTAKEIVEKADLLKNDLIEQKNNPRGIVRYAMPESCQWTPHYRKIMSQTPLYPDIQVDIIIATNKEIQDMLTRAEIDFAFVTGHINNPDTVVEKFADEHYSLVAKTKNLFKPIEDKKWTQLRLVGFPGNESFMITWADAHGWLSAMHSVISAPHVKIGNMAGAIHAAIEGAGALIVPTHCVQSEIAKGDLWAYNSPHSERATQPIYLIKRPQEALPRRCQIMMDLLIKSKKGLL